MNWQSLSWTREANKRAHIPHPTHHLQQPQHTMLNDQVLDHIRSRYGGQCSRDRPWSPLPLCIQHPTKRRCGRAVKYEEESEHEKHVVPTRCSSVTTAGRTKVSGRMNMILATVSVQTNRSPCNADTMDWNALLTRDSMFGSPSARFDTSSVATMLPTVCVGMHGVTCNTVDGNGKEADMNENNYYEAVREGPGVAWVDEDRLQHISSICVSPWIYYPLLSSTTRHSA